MLADSALPDDYIPWPEIIPGTGDFLNKYPWRTDLKDYQLDALERAREYLGEAKMGSEFAEVFEKFGESVDDISLDYYEHVNRALFVSYSLEYELRNGDAEVISRAHKVLCDLLQPGERVPIKRDDMRVTILVLKAIEKYFYRTIEECYAAASR